MFAQQLPHQHLVEPIVQLPREKRANSGAMLLQLAHHLAPNLPQEPLQDVLHGAEHTGGVTRVAMQLLIHFGSFSLPGKRSHAVLMCYLSM